MKTNIVKLQKRFATLKTSVREFLERQKVPTEKFADVLTSFDADDCYIIFIESRINILYGAGDIAEQFGMMDFHWSYLDPSLLDHLVRRFDLEEMKGQMETYKSDLGQFRKTTPLTLFCRAQEIKKVRLSPDFQELVAEFDWPNEVMLEDVEQFREEYVHHYGLHECAMILDQIRNL